jgi:phosphoribosylanthranilate isomerase
MENIRLKVCGLRDNIEEVVTLEPDYAGFIFYSKSPRFVGDDFNMPRLGGPLKKVGVFVNESLETIRTIAMKFQLDLVQLHGDEVPAMCAQLKDMGLGVIKAFQMDDEFIFEELKPYESVVDYFLFDTRTKLYGGSGKTFNWEILEKYRLEKEYFLSGGISLDNLDGLSKMDVSRIHALDVNSRFEVKPGLKDIKLLEKLGIELKTINSKSQNSKYK